MTRSASEKAELDRRVSFKVHSPRSNGFERTSSGKVGIRKISCGRSFCSQKDARERGSRSWTFSEKDYGLERHCGSKHEASRKGSSLERDRFEASEGGRSSSTRAAAQGRDLLDRSSSDRFVEHRSSLRKGSNSSRDGVERKRAKVIFLKGRSTTNESSDRQSGPTFVLKGERRDREGSKGLESPKAVSERVEGTKILSLKALNYERDGRGKVHLQNQFSPTSKGQNYERMTEFWFPKGARSERDRSKREDGSKVQGRDLRCGNKIAVESIENVNLNSTAKSTFEVKVKQGEDMDKHTISTSPSDGETGKRDTELHITEENHLDIVEKRVESAHSSSPEEGSCIPVEDVRVKAANKFSDADTVVDTYNTKDQSTLDKSEREEGELYPEEEDVQGIAESKTTDHDTVAAEHDTVADGSPMTMEKEVKGARIGTEEEGAVREQASCRPEVVLTHAGEEGASDSLPGSDTKEVEVDSEHDEECKVDMEVESPCSSAYGRSSDRTETDENLKDSGLNDEVRATELLAEKKTDEDGCQQSMRSSIADEDIMLSSLEKQGERTILPEIVIGEPGIDNVGTSEQVNNKAGTGDHVDSEEQVDVALESEDRHQHKKQKVEKLEAPFVSLSFPDTSLCLGSPGLPQLPRVPSRTKSIQSISAAEAHSNGVTTTLSLSYSHPFVHNPSCSLTQTSFDNQEVSTASQQVSQGNDWFSYSSWQKHGSDLAQMQRSKGMAFERSDPSRELSVCQKLRQNGNAPLFQGFEMERGRESLSHPGLKKSKRSSGSEKIEGCQISPGASRQLLSSIQLHESNLGHSHRTASEDRRDLSDKHKKLPKNFQKRLHCMLASPLPSVESREKQSEQHNLQKGRKDNEGETMKTEFSGKTPNFGRTEELSVTGHSGYGEKVELVDIASDPVAIVAKKMSGLPEGYLHTLKESLRDILGTFEKREEFAHLQNILLRRTDLSMETLSRAHRAQLEILVTMKTGIPAFLNKENPLTASAMVEIFLQLKCRNIHCQSQLPADDCECNICARRNGFCSACMCVVCSKFDFDANTCRWVGCDFCMHWCHTECGLHSSSIMPGQSIKGAVGTSEMQFQCMACLQKSELFGFVKDVFTTCAESWQREVLAGELQCVQKIFHASEDKRGKQLCKVAQLMISSLENGVETAEVCGKMLNFFADAETEDGNVRDASKKSAFSLVGERDKAADAVRDLYKPKPAGIDQPLDLEKALVALRTYDRELEEKRVEAAEIQYDKSARKAEIEELESQMRIKQAESQMFQVRADEARRHAEGLRCIVLAKCEMIKDEYATKIRKLHVDETQERRKRKMEELEICERSAEEFYNMKVRVTADIQDLLKKLEATKCQLL